MNLQHLISYDAYEDGMNGLQHNKDVGICDVLPLGLNAETELIGALLVALTFGPTVRVVLVQMTLVLCSSK